MENPIKVAEQLGFDVAFLPNNYTSSRISITSKRIEIGTEAKIEEIFDFPFICIAHETSHALDKEIEKKDEVSREFYAWKTALEEFLTFQPEIRLRIQKEIQLRLNRYIQYYVFGENVIEGKNDNQW
jgi:hypothetical protein